MRWIESDQPVVDPERLRARPDGAATLRNTELLPCGDGAVLIRSDTGGWVHLDPSEVAVVERLDVGPASMLDALWRRGVLSVDGTTAFGEPEVAAGIAVTQDTHMLVLLLNEGCNLVCSYCYLGHADPRQSTAMPDEVAVAAIEQACRHEAPRLLIDFGEVAVAEHQLRRLVPIAERLARSAGKRLAMSIQTNGTTLTDELADFLATHELSVGLSIDGPEHLHDAARTFRSGRGSYVLARAALDRCRERGISVHVPVTVAAHNIDHPVDVVEAIADLRPGSFLLKPVLPHGEAAEHWESDGISVRSFADFMTSAVGWAARHDVDLLDTTARKFLHRFVGDRRGWGDGCTSRQCGTGRLLEVVDRHGARHACPRFVMGSSSPELLQIGRARRSSFSVDQALRQPPPTCDGCSWLRSCGGGCTLAGGGSDAPLPDPHCLAHDAVHGALVRDVLPRLLDGVTPGRTTSSLRVVRLS